MNLNVSFFDLTLSVWVVQLIAHEGIVSYYLNTNFTNVASVGSAVNRTRRYSFLLSEY